MQDSDDSHPHSLLILHSHAVLYVLGVIVSLIGTGFLVGVSYRPSSLCPPFVMRTDARLAMQFGKQVKMMWDPVRRYAAGEYKRRLYQTRWRKWLTSHV